MQQTSRIFFSILTATLNVQETIHETLASVKNQSITNVEHLIMDGGSTDGTLNMIQSFENTYNLEYISSPDSGIAEALNKGIEVSRGRYLLVLHGDDKLITNDILSQTYSLLKREDIDICAFPVMLCRPSGKYTLMKPIHFLWWHHFKTIFMHQGVFVHRRVFDAVGGFRTKFKIAMDYDFFYRTINSKIPTTFETLPVAVMGGRGISARPDLLAKRLWEERIVQLDNERSRFWRLLQAVFWAFYGPYKTKVSPGKSYRP